MKATQCLGNKHRVGGLGCDEISLWQRHEKEVIVSKGYIQRRASKSIKTYLSHCVNLATHQIQRALPCSGVNKSRHEIERPRDKVKLEQQTILKSLLPLSQDIFGVRGSVSASSATSKMPLLDPATPTKTKRVDSESDDGADPELVELLRQHLGLSGKQGKNSPPETKVLENAQYIFDNAIDVALNPAQTKEAAETIWQMMQKKSYSTQTWSDHELHPQTKDENTVDFIFLMDLLNFSFWSEETDESKRFCIEYRGRRWTGYWSLVAAIQRALDEGQKRRFSS